MKDCLWGGRVLVLPVSLCLLVWNVVRLVVGVVLARCWVLKDQAGFAGVSLLVASLLAVPALVGVVGLVGLLFEICIVDASIL